MKETKTLNTTQFSLPCIPLTAFWQDGLDKVDMSTFVRDDEGWFLLNEEADEIKNLLISVKEEARFEGEPLVMSIDRAVTLSDIVVPLALKLKEVFTTEELILKHKPWRNPNDLVFESITIAENNVVDVFFGS